jgi:hypothetical protein
LTAMATGARELYLCLAIIKYTHTLNALGSFSGLCKKFERKFLGGLILLIARALRQYLLTCQERR